MRSFHQVRLRRWGRAPGRRRFLPSRRELRPVPLDFLQPHLASSRSTVPLNVRWAPRLPTRLRSWRNIARRPDRHLRRVDVCVRSSQGSSTPMSTFAKVNLKDVENQAPKFGMPEELEARFARSTLGGKTLGLSTMKLATNFPHPVRPQTRRARRGVRRGARLRSDQGRELVRRACRMGRDPNRKEHHAGGRGGCQGNRIPGVRRRKRPRRGRDGAGLVERVALIPPIGRIATGPLPGQTTCARPIKCETHSAL